MSPEEKAALARDIAVRLQELGVRGPDGLDVLGLAAGFWIERNPPPWWRGSDGA